jgi:hypothetical protein
MNKLLLAIVLVVLPIVSFAADRTHTEGLDQECAECHDDQEKEWLSGKHGLMNVKCVVCHGAPEVNFAARPGLDRCVGCHADKVADVRFKLAAKEQTCFQCHERHAAGAKGAARRGFHGEGGAQ